MPRFFISYSRKDGFQLAQKLERDISRLHQKNDVFLDKSDIMIGDNWERSIQDNIERCDVFILVISESSLQSEWVRKETEIAKASELKTGLRKLFIVKYPGIPYPEYISKENQFLELTKNWTLDFYRLMSGINSNISFFSIKENKTLNDGYYDIVLYLGYSDILYKDLVSSVEYRFDNEFMQSELAFKKVLLKKNKEKDFRISFWTTETITVFVVIYLKNTKQINFIHRVEIG
jgi:hypothetical protein